MPSFARNFATQGHWKNTFFSVVSPEGLEENFSNDSGKGALRIYAEYHSRWQALKDFVGFSEVATVVGGSTKYIHRDVPYTHPVYQTLLYADSMRLVDDKRPVAATDLQAVPGRLADHTETIATIGFFTPLYPILSDQEQLDVQLSQGLQNNFPDESLLTRYVEIRYEPRAKFQTLPPFGPLKWNDTLKPMASTVAIILHQGDFHVTWKQVPVEAYPRTAIDNCIGKTNAALFGTSSGLLGVFGGPVGVGKLLCAHPAVKLYRMVNSKWCVDIAYKFSYYPNAGGCNAFYRWDGTAASRGFQKASFDGISAADTVSQNLLFPAADLNSLFRPEP